MMAERSRMKLSRCPVMALTGSRSSRYKRERPENHTGFPHTSTSLDDFGNIVLEDSFQREVAEKTNVYLIGKQDAENEVYIDHAIATEGSRDKALLYIVDELKNEERVQVLLSCLLSRGANPSAHNDEGETPLHMAVKNNFKGVCKKLLENGAWPSVRNRRGQLPFYTAFDNRNDEIASMLILHMKNYEVRAMFSSSGQNKSEFSFHDLLRSEKMEKTVMSVLNCMIDLIGTDGKANVFFHVLESDENGHSPVHQNFEIKDKSPFQIIAKSENKTIVNHDVMRLLIRRKWKHFARMRFLINAVFFMSTLFCVAFSAITAAKTANPLVYDDHLDRARAVCEVLSVIAAIITLFQEIHHIIKHKLEYFKEKFNYLELASSLFLLILIPLRFTNNSNQWQIHSVVFLLWTLRIFKYASVFRHTGAYAQILVRVIMNDFFQFMVVFAVFLMVFSGTLLLALRGGSQSAVIDDTSSFWAILFLGFRILIESEKVIEYTSIDGWSCFVVVLFLFCCIVLLLNLLIAQLSDTYQHIQNDAQRGLEVNRAWIVARIELRSMLIKRKLRVKFFQKKKEVKDIHKVLEKWESPPLQEMNKNMQNIDECLGTHKLNLVSVSARLARQERTLIRIQETLDSLSKRMVPEWTTNNINNELSVNEDVTSSGIKDNKHVQDGHSSTKVNENDNVQSDTGDVEIKDTDQVTFTLSSTPLAV
ncbi:transient receptor potential cation channel subfamily V member 2-like isoform X1 [Pecten maximus]|uniref:transient receptor potential cation channel subfamily V member 2-like isoform X1 n=1 Tax=Pecten maximus TaxID=6579 RepID=UPI0014581DF5|nr:transient receptor potential cation channel subfamily V member 2-like isoform X1 [Pecten maximus]